MVWVDLLCSCIIEVKSPEFTWQGTSWAKNSKVNLYGTRTMDTSQISSATMF